MGRFISRKIFANNPSIQSSVFGSRYPYNSATEQAFKWIATNRTSNRIQTNWAGARLVLTFGFNTTSFVERPISCCAFINVLMITLLPPPVEPIITVQCLIDSGLYSWMIFSCWKSKKFHKFGTQIGLHEQNRHRIARAMNVLPDMEWSDSCLLQEQI